MEKLLKEISVEGHSAYSLPENDVPLQSVNALLDKTLLSEKKPDLPSVSEAELNRHFTRLSKQNYALSTNFYPLGSCTMKYNPPVNEKIAKLQGFTAIHPLQPEETVQGALEVIYGLEKSLCEITGMDSFTLQPAAGAQGEFTGLLIIRAYFKAKRENRTKIIVPDSAHGTNPASAALAGFEIVPLKSSADGTLNPLALKEILSPEIAAIMLTVPNTLGVFEKEILSISELCHKNGSLLYYDGANLNALLGKARPGDLGFDIMHVNLHKTFATPHGGGGPGAGPVGVKKGLMEYLPYPMVAKKGNEYCFNYDMSKSIGKVRSFYGNFPVLLRAYAYILGLGAEGLKKVSEQAVINANYLLSILGKELPSPAGNRCMHEFVLSGKKLSEHNVRTLDVAKRLLDYGYYAPTIYFPLIVEEAIMIEPTETETKAVLDEFARVFLEVLNEAKNNPDLLKNAPQNTPVSRLNEVEAARKPMLHW